MMWNACELCMTGLQERLSDAVLEAQSRRWRSGRLSKEHVPEQTNF